MPAFPCGDFVCLKKMMSNQKSSKSLIKKQEPEFTITSAMRLLEEKLKTLPEIFDKKHSCFMDRNNVKVVEKYQELMYGTNIARKKDHMCIGERMIKIF